MQSLFIATCCAFVAWFFAAPAAFAAHWQNPGSYSRSPTGATPYNPVTISVSFDDESGCPSHTYSYWVFSGTTPLYQAAQGVSLQNGTLSQTIAFPSGTGVERIKLACLYQISNGWGSLYDATGFLESGSPAFTPQASGAFWDDPENYTRSPTGATPANPITLSVDFQDETGCPNKTYRFWVYGADVALYGLGSNTTLQNGTLTQTVSFPQDVGVDDVRLACTNADGTIHDVPTTPLEFGSPAFTPNYQATPANWQTPANYRRSPEGVSPARSVTFWVDFNDHTGCPTQTYSFWVFRADGTPLYKINPVDATVLNGVLEQTANPPLPNDIGIERIKLVCTSASGYIYDSSGVLESGSPAFTPYETPTSANWQTPASYARYPGGGDPAHPITFFAEFDDETGCPNMTYRFWVYDEFGAPVRGMGSNTTPHNGVFHQVVSLPNNIPVADVRLACTNANGTIYDVSDSLEFGAPAFTPHNMGLSALWQTPNNYTRLPAGNYPENPVTFIVNFDDETGCPTGTYSFWIYNSNGQAVQKVGTDVVLSGATLTQTASLPDGVGVQAVRLACTDAGGNMYDVSSNLESGTPAFSPYDAPYPAHWQTPANYTRSPSGLNPTGAITFSAYFDNESGCPTGTYSFWRYALDGTRLEKVGNDVSMQLGMVEQTVLLTYDVGIEAIRLVCTDEAGEFYDVSPNLESGSPAFTPREDLGVNWAQPENYTRTPAGSTPDNPITFTVDFVDQTGCPNGTYSFWSYTAGGTPVAMLGNDVSLVSGTLTQTVWLDYGVGIDVVRLGCTDANGAFYDVSDVIESGAPAFTPTISATPAYWQTPENYTRFPAGDTPLNPVTLSVDFNNQSGCPSQLYSFWVFDGTTPLYQVGPATALESGRLYQTTSFPSGVGIGRLKLACLNNVDENGWGGLYDATGFLEDGNGLPAFTPYDP